MSTTTDVLNTPMQTNDAGAATIRDYLVELLATLWREGEGFGGKRPFGNSGWQYELYHALLQAGYVEGRTDEDGYIEDVDAKTADRLIAAAITEALGHPEVPRHSQAAGQETQWCVWYGGPDPDSAAGVHVFDDPEDAHEALQWYRDDQGSGVAHRRVITTPWQVPGGVQ